MVASAEQLRKEKSVGWRRRQGTCRLRPLELRLKRHLNCPSRSGSRYRAKHNTVVAELFFVPRSGPAASASLPTTGIPIEDVPPKAHFKLGVLCSCCVCNGSDDWGCGRNLENGIVVGDDVRSNYENKLKKGTRENLEAKAKNEACGWLTRPHA